MCIIQDSVEDGAKEVNNMGSIYKKATLTILATNGTSANCGFLESRPLLDVCELPLCLPDGSLESIFLVKPFSRRPRHYAYRPKEALHQRGWALQEFLLSPRFLIYGEREMTWFCQSLFSPAIDNHIDYLQKGPCKQLPPIMFNPHIKYSATVHQQAALWREIVHDFTRRKLTFSEDRLPAIAGIAREMQSIWKDQYYAGMWDNCLTRHLGWYGEDFNPSRPISDYRAPSWSWASIDGKINLGGVKIWNAEVQILGCTVQSKLSGAPFGSALSGELNLKGILVEYAKIPRKEVCAWKFVVEAGPRNMITDYTPVLLLGRSIGSGATICMLLQHVSGQRYRRIGRLQFKHYRNYSLNPHKEDWRREMPVQITLV